MSPPIGVAAVAIVLTAGLAYIGYGVSRLILPPDLWRWRPLIIPFVGYSVTVIAFRVLHTYWLSGACCVVVILALATIVNAIAAIRWRFEEAVDWRDYAAPSLIALLVYVIALIPILSYGYMTAVGTSGDVEQYVASADYIRQFSAQGVRSAPANPLRDVTLSLLDSSYYASGLGISYILSLASTLLGQRALEVYAPTLAFFVAGAVLAMYVFARSALALSRRWSAFASLVLGLNALILWSSLFNFGRQVTVLAILPIAAVSMTTCVNRLSWRSVLFAVLMLVTVVISYWPGTVWFVTGAGIFVLVTAVARPGYRKVAVVLGAVVILGLLPVAASMPGYLNTLWAVITKHIVQGVPLSGNIVFSSFLPVSHVYGLDYYVWPQPVPVADRLGPALAEVMAWAQTVMLVVALCLGACGFWCTVRSRRFIALGLGMASLFALVVTHLSSDYYFYFKSLTFSSFVAVGLTVLGLATVWGMAGRFNHWAARLSARVVVSVISTSLVVLAATNQYLTIAYYFGVPQSAFASPYTDVAQLDGSISPDASIFLSSELGQQRWGMGAISYCLIPRAQYGTVRTGHYHGYSRQMSRDGGKGKYFTWSYGDPRKADEPGLCDYGLFSSREDPAEQGYSLTDLVWANEKVKMYEQGAGVAHVRLGDEAGLLLSAQEVDGAEKDPGLLPKDVTMVTRDLRNPGFEEDVDFDGVPDEWVVGVYGGKATVDRSEGVNGGTSVRVNVEEAPTGVGVVGRPVPMKSGDIYLFEVQVRADAGVVAGLEAQFRDAAGETIEFKIERRTGGEGWQKIELIGQVPDGAVEVIPHMRVFSAEQAGSSASFDNLRLASVWHPLEFVVREPGAGAEGSVADDDEETGKANHSLVFQFSSLADQRFSVEVNGDLVEQQVGPGLWRYETTTVDLPATVKVGCEGDGPLSLDWVQLRRSENNSPSLTKVGDHVLLQSSSTRDVDQIVTQLWWQGPEPVGTPGWMELRVRRVTSSEGLVIGSWPLSPDVEQTELKLRLADGVFEIGEPGATDAVSERAALTDDGQYVVEARAFLASDVPLAGGSEANSGGQSVELFRFTTQGGIIVDTSVKDDRLVHKYLPCESWIQADVVFGEIVELVGSTVDTQRLSVGESARFSLYWEVAEGLARDWRVLCQLVDKDGKIVGRRDESLKTALVLEVESSGVAMLRSDLEVVIDEAAAVGDCAIKVQVYSPVTMETLRVDKGVQSGSDHVLLSGFEVVK